MSKWPAPGMVYVQHKGTDICADVICPACGKSGHVDGMFAYYVKCRCGTVLKMPEFMEGVTILDDSEAARRVLDGQVLDLEGEWAG